MSNSQELSTDKRAALGVGGFIGIGRFRVCNNHWVDFVGKFGQAVTVELGIV